MDRAHPQTPFRVAHFPAGKTNTAIVLTSVTTNRCESPFVISWPHPQVQPDNQPRLEQSRVFPDCACILWRSVQLEVVFSPIMQ